MWSTRNIIAGGGDTGVELAKALIKEKHEVVLIESDKARVEELAEKLDCLVIHGDATNPSVLEESGVREADILIALMGDDHDNIVVSLIAKSRGVKKIIVRVNDPSYNDTLIYMGIEDIVNPSKLVVNQILAMVRGVNLFYLPIALHSSIRYQVHRIGKKLDGKKVSEVKLDRDKARILLVYRDDETLFADQDLVLREGDLVLMAIKPGYIDEVERYFKEKS